MIYKFKKDLAKIFNNHQKAENTKLINSALKHIVYLLPKFFFLFEYNKISKLYNLFQ